MLENKANSFLKDVLRVFSGSSLAQLFPMIGYLVILKQFDANQFGIYAIWLGVASLISILSTLKLEQIFAIEFIKRPKTGAFSYVAFISIILSLIISLVVSIIFYIFSYEYVSFYYVIWIFLGSLTSSIFRMYECYLVAISNFNLLIKVRVIYNFFIPFFQIILGIYIQTYEMLIIGFLGGSVVGIFYAYIKLEVKIFKKFNKSEIKNFLFEYSDIPSLKLPADFINNLSQQAPTFIVSYRFGEEYAGFLALTIKFLGAPLALIGRAIGDVFRPLIIKSIDNGGSCIIEFRKTSLYLLVISIALFVILSMFSEIIFIFLFGEHWITSGYFASLLSLMFAFRMMASPVSYVLTAYRKVGVELIIQIMILLLVVLGLSIYDSVNNSILLFSLMGSLGYLLYYLACLYFSLGKHLKANLK